MEGVLEVDVGTEREGDSGVSSHVEVALCYPSGPQCVTQTLQLCHYGPPPPAAAPACVSLCTCVRTAGTAYQPTCLPKPQFNLSGTVCMSYNIIIHSNQEAA